MESPAEQWARYRRALGGERLPAGLIDLAALRANIDRLVGAARAGGKTLRIATKSVRSPRVLELIASRGGAVVRGLMTYTAAETAFLASLGHADLLLAYPCVSARDAALLAAVNAGGQRAAVVADALDHLSPLEAAARAHATRIPVVVDLDPSYRPLRGAAHIGVRRSPLHGAAEVVALARAIASSPHLEFAGVMAYEAHLAGVPDRPASRVRGVAMRLMKHLARPELALLRRDTLDRLHESGLAPRLVNGGGSGSIESSCADPSLTEVTAGSGFLASHLFDGYRELDVVPAAYFALEVVRRPGDGLVTCLGGGYVASGAAGLDRLPKVVLPAGLSLLPQEGAGEVQTPLRVAKGVELALGDPVFFRHAKAGELAEHLEEYLLVDGDTIVERAKTYRGLGRCFLG